MECIETGTDVNDDGEAVVQLDEDNGNCVEEDEDNIHSDSIDEVCNASIALPSFSGCNGDPLKDTQFFQVFMLTRCNPEINLGARNRKIKKNKEERSL